MKLSISNIAWNKEQDLEVYRLMQKYGFGGLEIAPTRIFPEAPYDRLIQARKWSDSLHAEYGLCVSSMQSIWYGRTEMLFGTDEERHQLFEYTKKAIDFAAAISCPNLVFGSPKNRNNLEDKDPENMVFFFHELGEYACRHNTVLSMEANPPIYGTNYITDTESAIGLVERVNSEGFKLNLDLGTMLANQENIEILKGYESLIHHVHISEVDLLPIEQREMHRQLADVLRYSEYQGYVSIEMKNPSDMNKVFSAMAYVREVFE